MIAVQFILLISSLAMTSMHYFSYMAGNCLCKQDCYATWVHVSRMARGFWNCCASAVHLLSLQNIFDLQIFAFYTRANSLSLLLAVWNMHLIVLHPREALQLVRKFSHESSGLENWWFLKVKPFLSTLQSCA